MKRILVVLGGGRPRGNTRQLVDSFMQGATDAGHDVEFISLNNIEVKGCMGCNACRYAKPCIQKDDFNELVPKIKNADLIVFASPLLFWTYEQAVSYYKFVVINYIGFHDRGMLLAGGCGDTNGKPQINKTSYLKEAYEFGERIYEE